VAAHADHHLRRRDFVTLLGGAAVAWPRAAHAPQRAKIPRIGFMGNSTAMLEANLLGPFRERLRELGYEECRNVAIEYRWDEGHCDRFPALVAELLAAKVDVIVTAGTPASLAVKKARSTTVPLVFVISATARPRPAGRSTTVPGHPAQGES
jgi:putative ABC transport system substrate-binding protein